MSSCGALKTYGGERQNVAKLHRLVPLSEVSCLLPGFDARVVPLKY